MPKTYCMVFDPTFVSTEDAEQNEIFVADLYSEIVTKGVENYGHAFIPTFLEIYIKDANISVWGSDPRNATAAQRATMPLVYQADGTPNTPYFKSFLHYVPNLWLEGGGVGLNVTVIVGRRPI